MRNCTYCSSHDERSRVVVATEVHCGLKPRLYPAIIITCTCMAFLKFQAADIQPEEQIIVDTL